MDQMMKKAANNYKFFLKYFRLDPKVSLWQQ